MLDNSDRYELSGSDSQTITSVIMEQSGEQPPGTPESQITNTNMNGQNSLDGNNEDDDEDGGSNDDDDRSGGDHHPGLQFV